MNSRPTSLTSGFAMRERPAPSGEPRPLGISGAGTSGFAVTNQAQRLLRNYKPSGRLAKKGGYPLIAISFGFAGTMDR
jgi:hypothetical protein